METIQELRREGLLALKICQRGTRKSKKGRVDTEDSVNGSLA